METMPPFEQQREDAPLTRDEFSMLGTLMGRLGANLLIPAERDQA
jgi:hypothetical protein